jgi:hypothetical protein
MDFPNGGGDVEGALRPHGPPASATPMPSAPDGWPACPFGWDTLDTRTTTYLLRRLCSGGGGGTYTLPKQTRDAVLGAVFDPSSCSSFRELEGSSKGKQLAFLREVYTRGALTPEDVPEWARTAASVVAQFDVRKPREVLPGFPMRKAAVTMGALPLDSDAQPGRHVGVSRGAAPSIY